MELRSSWMLLALTATAMIVTAVTAEHNKSGGLYWSTAEEEAQAQLQPRVDDSAVGADFDADGGFSSLDSMLQWALGHSDPDQLKEAAKEVQGLSHSDLNKKRLEIKQLMEDLKTPSDAQLMKVAILDLKNSSLPLEDRHRALEELLELVEPIDNANDLNKLGGFTVVTVELDHSDSETRKMAAWIIGKASQNNPLVQKQVLELGALTKLMDMVKSSFVEEAIKAMYAVSALLRNNIDGQEMFYLEDGDKLLQDIVSDSSIGNRLRIRAVVLLGDLAEFQILENAGTNKYQLPFFSNHTLLKSLVDITSAADLQLQEKALTTIKNLLRLKTTKALVFKDFCGLDAALERMRLRLQNLLVEEYHRDYAMDVESLRSEVQLIFQRKLEKETGMTA
ncbi:hsp70 nucleotide exchange factor FES1 [Argentina anserina]|uniref:hsp70 nucleotide exchange factor FES1 n=1 Tax=Argentina anserina TaxID=57926 RepID=UPI0021767768|nr:hsp70 nucleotide exchange factor FES1 [Potentilla anserina]